NYGRRARRLHQCPGFAGIKEAAGLSRVWHSMYAGKSVGSSHGLNRRGVRRLLSLPPAYGRELGAHVSTKTIAERNFEFSCPAPLLPAKDTILLGHGSGGKLSAELIRDIFLPAFQNPVLARLDDQAIVNVNGQRLAITTDSFVVKPLFFPGGDIGSLAVHGTINDLAMGGATPLFLSAAFIIEEGFSMDELRRVVSSLREAAAEAGVQVVTGDTKV